MPRIDITEDNMAEKTKEAFRKIDNPVTIKDFYVNNLLDAADKVYKNYNGTEEQKNELAGILQTEAWESKENGGLAFFDSEFSKALEINLENRDLPSLKANRDKLLTELLPKIHNFPLDKKVAAEFTAIVTSSLGDAVRSKAAQMGIENTAKEPAKPKELEKVTSEQQAAIAVPAK